MQVGAIASHSPRAAGVVLTDERVPEAKDHAPSSIEKADAPVPNTVVSMILEEKTTRRENQEVTGWKNTNSRSSDPVDSETEVEPEASSRRLHISVDHDSEETSIMIIDKETQEVIREVPPEEVRKITEKIQKTMGLMYDNKA